MVGNEADSLDREWRDYHSGVQQRLGAPEDHGKLRT